MPDESTPGAEPLREFLSEGEEIIEKLGRDLIALDRNLRREGGGDGTADPDLLNDIFRGAHSLKGLSGMFGFKALTSVSHNLENLLDALRLGRVPLDASILDLLFGGLDLLGRQIKGLGEAEADDSADAAEIQAFISRLNAAAGGARGEPTTAAAAGVDPAILAVLTEFEEHRLDENIRTGRSLYRARASFDLATFDTGLADLTARLKALGEVITTLPGATAAAPGRIDFDVVVASERPIEAVTAALDGLEATVTMLLVAAAPRDRLSGTSPRRADAPAPSERTPRPGESAAPGSAGRAAAPQPRSAPEPPRRADVPTSSAGTPRRVEVPAGTTEAQAVEGDGSLRSTTQTVRVDIARLDVLMTIVGELVLDKTVIGGIADELKQAGGAPALASALAKASRSLGKKLADLQERVMEVRMVPLSQAFDKMARTVRKLSREAGKEVDLAVSGADTKLDKLIVEELVDPLMHIIRNAIDHGIELPEERRSAGKPARGRVDLRAFQKGNHVVIEVEDDGRGLDFDRVREVAVARGLLPADSPTLKPREAFDLLCMPGFSTRDSVTEISGRGVGMDVVKTSIAQLSGVLDFETTRGVGTRMIITLPMTLAIIQALVVQACGRTYAVPLNQVQENLMVAPSEILTIERREVIQLRERTLPLTRLERLFALARPEGWRPGGSRADGSLYVVVVGMGERSLGIVVDELLGQQDVVIKSIGELLKGVRGIAGAADLGNQQTILVLDVGTVIDDAIALEAGRREVAG
jgi:two-component system, chemotaxis family, sensor kinase CheA